MFDDDFFEGMPEDTFAIGKYICKTFIAYMNSRPDTNDLTPMYLEFYALLSSFIEAKELTYRLPELSNNDEANRNSIKKLSNDLLLEFKHQHSLHVIGELQGKFRQRFSTSFSYKFTDGDLSKVQELLNEMRDLISDNDEIEDEYKKRILRRLEKLQSELHKNMSDMDRFLGVIMDISIVAGKAGDNAKPLVDRLQELKNIFWSTQVRAEELESGTPNPLLGNENNENI